ncbi:MAG: recombinase family protein [Bacillota bacterium]
MRYKRSTMRYYSIGRLARLPGITPKRIREWEKQGRIRCVRLPSGHRRYPEEEVRRILGESSPEGVRVAVYARVSTRKQADAGNLERQKERLLACAALKGYRVVHVFEDVASGLNRRRRGLESWPSLRPSRLACTERGVAGGSGGAFGSC